MGIVFHVKTGDFVNADEPLLEYYCSDKDRFESGKLYFNETIHIQTELPDPVELIYT